MTVAPKITSPVSRIRRITGLALIALGVLVVARVGWLGAFYGRWFGHAEWIRFAGWLWLGAVCALAGCWLAYRSRAARWALMFAAVALMAMAYVHDRSWR